MPTQTPQCGYTTGKTRHSQPQYQGHTPGTLSSYTCTQVRRRRRPGRAGQTDRYTCVPPCMKGCRSPSSQTTSYHQPPPRPNPTPRQPPPPGSGPTHAPRAAVQRRPSKPASPATKASCTQPTITHRKATPYGGNTPRQTRASGRQPTNQASAQNSQRLPTLSPSWPKRSGRCPNGHQPSSKRRRHATSRHSHT